MGDQELGGCFRLDLALGKETATALWRWRGLPRFHRNGGIGNAELRRSGPPARARARVRTNSNPLFLAVPGCRSSSGRQEGSRRRVGGLGGGERSDRRPDGSADSTPPSSASERCPRQAPSLRVQSPVCGCSLCVCVLFNLPAVRRTGLFGGIRRGVRNDGRSSLV